MNQYRTRGLEPLNHPMTIGLMVQDAEGFDCESIVEGIAESLPLYQATPILPYNKNGLRKADVVVNIASSVEHSGSGWNFLVNFPGFLVWAPAWNGYVYSAEYKFEFAMTHELDNKRIDAWATPICLNMRHADIDRTWTEVSWLEFGAIAFVGGLVFIQYDDDVTMIIGDKMRKPLGNYLAQQIVKRINAAGVVPARNDAPAKAMAAPVPELVRP